MDPTLLNQPKDINEMAIDRLADKVIFWIQQANTGVPDGCLKTIVPSREELISEVYMLAAQDIEDQDVSS